MLANVGGQVDLPLRGARSAPRTPAASTARAARSRALLVGEQTLEIVVGEDGEIAFLCSGLQRKGLTIVTARFRSLEQRLSWSTFSRNSLTRSRLYTMSMSRPS